MDDTLLDEQDISKLSALLGVRDDQGRVALKIGFVSTVFFADAWTRPVREAVSAAAEEYIQAVREHLRWARRPGTGHMHPLATGRIAFPWEWMPRHEDGKSWDFGYHGAEGEEEASELLINAYGPDGIKKGPGFFQVYLPLTWFADHPGTFQRFVLRIAKRLRPLSGYGNIGIQEPLDHDGSFRARPLVRQLAERFPGLEVENPIAQRLSIEDGGIKGASWLTLLGEENVRALGGLVSLQTRLGTGFPITPYEGGLMIQAGPRPQIGDVQTGQWPRPLVTLAKVLRPIQVKEHYYFHTADMKGTPHMDHEASNAWIHRFDGK